MRKILLLLLICCVTCFSQDLFKAMTRDCIFTHTVELVCNYKIITMFPRGTPVTINGVKYTAKGEIFGYKGNRTVYMYFRYKFEDGSPENMDYFQMDMDDTAQCKGINMFHPANITFYPNGTFVLIQEYTETVPFSEVMSVGTFTITAKRKRGN